MDCRILLTFDNFDCFKALSKVAMTNIFSKISTCGQSFIVTFSYSLAQQIWGLF